MSLANFLEPATFVLSPIFIKLDSGLTTSGSSPLNLKYGSVFGIFLGFRLLIFSDIALMWSGVVPQHPPTRLIKPLPANSSKTPEVIFGVSSYSPISFGSPAFG